MSKKIVYDNQKKLKKRDAKVIIKMIKDAVKHELLTETDRDIIFALLLSRLYEDECTMCKITIEDVEGEE